jgi:fatty-acyl-CoA synthase
MLGWSEVMAMASRISDEQLAQRQASCKPDDVINMQYTSGHDRFSQGGHVDAYQPDRQCAVDGECMRLTSEDRLCIPVPFFHCFGCVLGTLTCVVSAACMCPVVAFNSRRCAADHGSLRLYGSARRAHHVHRRTGGDGKNKYNTSTLRTGIMAGAPCPIEVMKKVVNDMGASEICITYGQTEASPGITMTRTDDPLERGSRPWGGRLPMWKSRSSIMKPARMRRRVSRVNCAPAVTMS